MNYCSQLVRSLLCVLQVVIFSIIVISSTGEAAEIIAHRGASFDAPENTLASINLAWEQKADAVEIDVYLSKDSRIVAMHDRTPKRYGGPDTKISEMTWDQIQKLDVGNWKNPKFKGERIPLLADVLKTIPAGHRLFIEIKSGPEIVPELKKVLREAGRPSDQTCIICFNTKVIAATVRELPDLKSYWLVSMKSGNGKKATTAKSIITTAKKLGAHGVDLGGKTELITAPLVEKLKQADLPCYAWTVNQPEEALRLAKIGVLGITTDKPALLIEKGIQNVSAEH